MIVLGLLACAADALHGTLTDARLARPIVDQAVRAEHTDTACLRVSTPTDESGAFVVENPCAGMYTLAPIDAQWWLPEPVTTRGATAATLEAWRVPPTPGVYRLAGDELTSFMTNTPLSAGTLTSGESVRYPLVLPGSIPQLAHDDAIVLVGSDLSAWNVRALLASSALHPLESGSADATGPWFVLGPAATAKMQEVTGEAAPKAVRYLLAGELAAGRYVLSSPDAPRGVLFETVGL